MPRTLRTALVAACFALATTAPSRRAHADALTIRTVTGSSWPTAVAALESNVHAEGSVTALVVLDAQGQRLGCGTYALQLDDVATHAFAIERCDAITRATDVRLVHRDALFDHTDIVPTPRVAGVSAVSMLSGGARGGAGNSGGSDVSCSVAVRPFVRDLEHGTNVYLTPDRFTLRTVSPGIVVATGVDGWTLGGNRSASVTVEYEVTDSHGGRVVLHDRATLHCGSERLDSPASAPAGQSSSRITEAAALVAPAEHTSTPGALSLGGTIAGTTVGAVDREHASCGGAYSGDRGYTLRIDAPTRVRLQLFAEFDAIMVLRSDRASPAELVCAGGIAAHARVIDRTLAAGIYRIIVDGRAGAEGSFRLTVTELPYDAPREPDPDIAGALTFGSVVHGRTSGGASAYTGSCVGANAPEVVYVLRVPTRALVSVLMESDYDGGLYLRRSIGDANTEVACNDDAGDTRHSRLDRVLDPGTYYLFVDGFGTASGSYTVRVVGSTEETARANVRRGELHLGASASANIDAAVSLSNEVCGRDSGPEHSYELRIERPTWVTLRVESSAEGSLSLRDLRGHTLGCNGAATDARHFELSQHLTAGTYAVVVDTGTPAGARYTLRAVGEPDP